jgi:hypothetical protein
MVNPNRFYTYAYLREDRTPYYIGKGNRQRIYYKCKGQIKPPKDKSRIIFLKQNLTEEEAFKHEIYMINVFGRKDLETGILHNRTNGGEGQSGVIRSEEIKKKYGKGNIGKKWWNDGKGNIKLSAECPGNNWVLGVNEEHKRKCSLAHIGKKLWTDGCGNSKKAVECPGNNWVLGVSEELRKKFTISNKGKHIGKKWWNDGKGNSKMSLECPGEGWVLGISEEQRKNMSKASKCKHTGKKWWNDGKGNSKMSLECPGEGWVLGMKSKING